MPITPSLRHCSNKYASKGRRERKIKSQVASKETSLQLLLEGLQESSLPDGGGKIIPAAKNVNENVLESDFKPLCEVTTRRCSLSDPRLLERKHNTHSLSLGLFFSV